MASREPYDEKILWAAELAQLVADFDLLPSGMQTVLGEKGVTLSGGQRQRTSLSRALARNPSILILDDVFSSLDSITESRIHTQLKGLLGKCTTLLLSHRLSTLRSTDFIVVLEQGKIVQMGPHESLVREPGYYHDLNEVQQLKARLEKVP